MNHQLSPHQPIAAPGTGPDAAPPPTVGEARDLIGGAFERRLGRPTPRESPVPPAPRFIADLERPNVEAVDDEELGDALRRLRVDKLIARSGTRELDVVSDRLLTRFAGEIGEPPEDERSVYAAAAGSCRTSGKADGGEGNGWDYIDIDPGYDD